MLIACYKIKVATLISIKTQNFTTVTKITVVPITEWPMDYQQLTTNRLMLRKFCKSDLHFINHHFSNKHVTQFLYDTEPIKTMEEAEELLDWTMDITSGDHLRWCIVHKRNNTPIGTCGFHQYDKNTKSAEIGYDLDVNFWNQGYMNEALQILLQYAQNYLGLQNITACIAIDNIASEKLIQKLGFHHKMTDPQKHLFRGRYYAHHIYELCCSHSM